MNIKQIFDWWTSQLAEWVPDSIKSHFGNILNRLVIEVEPESIRVHADVEGERHDFGRIDSDKVIERRRTLNTFLASLPRRPAIVEVRVPTSLYLQREIELPMAAETNLRETISFQLDRLTPFDPDNVLFECGVASQDSAKKRLRAWVSVTPEEPVDNALGLLGDSPRIAVRADKARPAENAPMILRYTNEHTNGNRKLPWALITLNIALLAGAVAIHLSNRKLEMETLEAALSEARQEAAETTRLRESAEQLRMEAVAIQDKRASSPLAVTILNDLTNRLEDDTWLQRFEVRDGQLRVYGVAKSASPLIAKLEASPLFTDVRFESSVTRDAATGGERFSIMARLINPDSSVIPGKDS